jgi:hypothetical protein
MANGSQQLQHLAPRHIEIMHRLIRGQKAKTIAEDLGITQSRLSIIIHSPLFQLEMQKLMAAKEEQLYVIQENFVDAAGLGVKFHKDVLSAPPGMFSTDQKFKSANTMTVLASRLLRPVGQPSNGDGDEEGYEERLRKVTIEESIRTKVAKPQKEEEPSLEENAIDALLIGESVPDDEVGTTLEGEIFSILDGEEIPQQIGDSID